MGSSRVHISEANVLSLCGRVEVDPDEEEAEWPAIDLDTTGEDLKTMKRPEGLCVRCFRALKESHGRSDT
jgi:hypothetical protein